MGSIIPAMLMPGIIGTSTAKAIASAPTIMLLLYWAALGLQKTSGANSSQIPTKAAPHCAHQFVLLDREKAPKNARKIPLNRSLTAKMLMRTSTGGRPLSSVSANTAWPTVPLVAAS